MKKPFSFDPHFAPSLYVDARDDEETDTKTCIIPLETLDAIEKGILRLLRHIRLFPVGGDEGRVTDAVGQTTLEIVQEHIAACCPKRASSS